MQKKLFYLVAVMVLVVALWDTPVIYPLRILVVFFHELSHGLMAIATGGRIDHIEIVAQEGGVCYTMGGSRFLTLTAGYLGSLVWGGLIYYVAASTRKDRLVMLALGVMVLAIAALYLRNGFGFLFSLGAGGLMVLSARKLPENVNDFCLRLIGMTSMLYAPLDIVDDTLKRSHLPSDAHMLAQEFGGTTMLWGGIWVLISVVLLIGFVWISIRHEAGLSEKKTAGSGVPASGKMKA